jgi:dynein heavy chain 1
VRGLLRAELTRLQRVYPHAVSLMETVRTYSQTCDRVAANPGIAPLVAEYRTDAQSMIAKGPHRRVVFAR